MNCEKIFAAKYLFECCSILIKSRKLLLFQTFLNLCSPGALKWK